MDQDKSRKIETPFPVPRRHSAGGDINALTSAPVIQLDENNDPPPPADEAKLDLDLDPKSDQVTPYCSEHGDIGSEETKEVSIKESQNDIPTADLDEIAPAESIKESWDDYSYPSELVLHCEMESPSISQPPSSSSSSSDSEPDSPIASFCPSESDEDFQNYAHFMSHFRTLIKTHVELLFKLDDYFEQSLVFPPRLDLSDWNVPEVVTSQKLKTLKIFVPKSLCNYLRLPPTAVPVDQDGKNIVQYEEQVICDQVSFLLRKIQSFNLRNFVFVNDCDGSKIGKMSRIALWSNRIEKFLNIHSYTLEKISIQSVMNQAVAKYIPIPPPEDEDEEKAKKRDKFPHLQELELVFWPPPHRIEKSQDATPWLKNYWVQLLRSRERVGQLTRLVWMCPYQISFEEVWTPIFDHNKESLKTLHILLSDSTVPVDQAESLREKTFSFISCSRFIGLVNLENLYLRNTLCFLQRLDLLPESLTELSLDGLGLESREIMDALKKLRNLRKLRLVDTRPVLISMKYYSFGVDFDVIKGILNHRKLDEVYIWGYTLTERRKRKIHEEETKKPEPVEDDGEPRRSRSRFQNLKDIFSTVKSGIVNARSRAERRKADRWQAKPDLKMIQKELKKIGKVDENLISIK